LKPLTSTSALLIRPLLEELGNEERI